MNIDNLPEILTLTQVCEILNVHPNTLRNWDKNGQLRAMRIGVKRIRRYKKDSIMNFFEGYGECQRKKLSLLIYLLELVVFTKLFIILVRNVFL